MTAGALVGARTLSGGFLMKVKGLLCFERLTTTLAVELCYS